MDTGQQIIIGVSILLAVWFVLASGYNRRRGVNTYRWLQSGLEPIGPIGEARWIGTSGSGARLVIAKADRPFRRMDMVFLLESRELLPLWLVNHYLRRRRDLLIVKADLRRAPIGELQLQRRRPPAPSGGRAKPDSPAPTEGDYPAGLMASGHGPHLDRWRAALTDWLEAYGPSVKAFSISRASPHVILEIYTPQLTIKPGSQFFQHFKEAMARLSGPSEPET